MTHNYPKTIISFTLNSISDKKKCLISSLTAIVLSITCFNLSAQVTYTYDASGNRLSRTIQMSSTSSRTKKAFTQDSTARKDAISNLEVTIYPNPTKGILKISIKGLSESESATVTLSNTKGDALLVRKAGNSLETIDMTSMPDGVYLMKICYASDVKIWKIIKE